MSSPIVSMADAVRCSADLETRDGATVTMLRLLGLDALADGREREPDDVREEVGRVATGPRQLARGRGTPVADAAAVSDAGESSRGATIDSERLQTSAASTSPLTTRLRRLPPVQVVVGPGESAAALPPAASASPPPEPDPLFAPTQRRAILTAAITTFVGEGRLDIPTIVRATVSQRPLPRLPRLLRGTVRRGVQVLVDRSSAMVPFWRDEDQIVGQLRSLLGRGRLEVLTFRGFPLAIEDPADVVRNDEDQTPLDDTVEDPQADAPSALPRWRPPRRGTPVLIVSDFAIGASVDDEDWVPVSRWFRFAEDLRGLGCSVVGLIPYGRSRWPSGLSRRISCIAWSERTTAGTVRRTIRRLWAGVP
jgi:hypothetical protein